MAEVLTLAPTGSFDVEGVGDDVFDGGRLYDDGSLSSIR